MLYPSINLLREKVDSKYTLVAMASKRARDLIDGKPALVDASVDKPVSIATEEIAAEELTYSRAFKTEAEALEIEREKHLAALYEQESGEMNAYDEADEDFVVYEDAKSDDAEAETEADYAIVDAEEEAAEDYVEAEEETTAEE